MDTRLLSHRITRIKYVMFGRSQIYFPDHVYRARVTLESIKPSNHPVSLGMCSVSASATLSRSTNLATWQLPKSDYNYSIHVASMKRESLVITCIDRTGSFEYAYIINVCIFTPLPL